VHRLLGKPCARCKPDAVRAAVLQLYEHKEHHDFRPTLLAEYLARRRLAVNHETVIVVSAVGQNRPGRVE
jgi:hypothetical protein